MVTWNDCNSVYKHLAHHYILQRSVVFIVDTEFDCSFFKDTVMNQINKFFDGLKANDQFGFIPINSNKSDNSEIILEKKSANMEMKK